MGNLKYQSNLNIDNNKINYQIPTYNLNQGLYILKISTENSVYYSKKFIKI